MATKEKKSAAMRALERAAGGPLTLGRLLEAIRLGEDETLDGFAKKLGVSRTNLCDIEKGRRSVSLERAAQWAKDLGYDPSWFVQLALQDQVNAAGLRLRVGVTRAAA